MFESDKIPLSDDEIIIDSWDLYYTFTNGKNYFGLMTVTTKRVFFELASHNHLKEILDLSNAFKKITDCVLELEKEKISCINTEKSLLCKRIIITLNNGETHILDRKLLSIDRLVRALERNN